MLSIVVLDSNKENENNITSILKSAYSRRDLPIKSLVFIQEFQLNSKNAIEYIDKCNVFIASLIQNTVNYLEFAQALKRKKKDLFIVFLADYKTDISDCVRPSVRPAGILFIPIEKLKVYQTIREIYNENLRVEKLEDQPVFRIKNGAEVVYLNTGDISFFEAKGKKMAVKTNGQEIMFYSNFETAMEQLPDYFIRCHKGFVVNTKKILKVNSADMTITLSDKCIIPISRTYHSDIKGIFSLREI